MSGHSKWRQIKRKKDVTDSKRGQEFTRLAKQIQIAARDNADPDSNATLREAIKRARQANMPQINVDRLLGRVSEAVQKTTYEAFGPGGVALLIIVGTNNTNRTVAEIRTLLKDNGGTLGQPGCVAWKFKINTDGQHTVLYPQTLPAEITLKAVELVSQLKDHPDVEEVFTDMAQN